MTGVVDSPARAGGAKPASPSPPPASGQRQGGAEGQGALHSPGGEPVPAPSLASPLVSVVVPLYEEAENVEPLVEALREALAGAPFDSEVILVDDGSGDDTPERLRCAVGRASSRPGRIRSWRVLRLGRNFGQSAALQAGIDDARGAVVVTLDGDLQNDPADIPGLVGRLLDEDLDLVSGWRVERQDDLLRRLPSVAANWLIGRMTGVRLHDYGCTLKAYRHDVLSHVRLYGEMHRFVPAWLSKYTSPDRIAEQPVRHHPRTRGRSKYGLSRVGRVFLDLVSVLFFLNYSARPGHVFGGIGVFLGGMGTLMLLYLLGVKLSGEDIGNRPMLLAGVLLVVTGVQLLTTGVLAELLTRIYYDRAGSGGRGDQSYVVRARHEWDAGASPFSPPGVPEAPAQAGPGTGRP